MGRATAQLTLLSGCFVSRLFALFAPCPASSGTIQKRRGLPRLPRPGGHDFPDRQKHLHRSRKTCRQRSRHSLLHRLPYHHQGLPSSGQSRETAMLYLPCRRSCQVPNSIHGMLGDDACQSCHGNAHDVKARDQHLCPPNAPSVMRRKSKTFAQAFTGRPRRKRSRRAELRSCHGPVHQIQVFNGSNFASRQEKPARHLRHLPQQSRIS